MNMRESIVKIFTQSIINMTERRPLWRAIIALRSHPLNKLRKHVLSRNDLKPFEITENLTEWP